MGLSTEEQFIKILLRFLTCHGSRKNTEGKFYPAVDSPGNEKADCGKISPQSRSKINIHLSLALDS